MAGDQIVQFLRECPTVSLLGHKRADGDCVGSMVALGAFLESKAKKVYYLLPGGVPGKYRFLLPEARLGGPKDEAVSCAVTLDIASADRMEDYLGDYQAASKRVVIDHHRYNDLEGDIRWVNPEASSVAEMLWWALKDEDLPRIALDGLYLGMVTDTGRFSFSNTKADTLEAAAELVRRGVDGPGLFERVYRNRSVASIHLEAAVLGNLQVVLDGKVAVAWLDHGRFRLFEGVETEDIAARVLEVAGVRVGVLLLETEPGIVKIGLRARGGVDAGAVAAELGGGGHGGAAGAEVGGGIGAVKAKVLGLLRGAVVSEGGQT